MSITCRRCPAHVGFTLRSQTFANGTTHVRAECAACGAFVRLVPKTPDNVALAGDPSPVPPPAPTRPTTLADLLNRLARDEATPPRVREWLMRFRHADN